MADLGRREAAAETGASQGDLDACRAELERCRKTQSEKDAQIAGLKDQLASDSGRKPATLTEARGRKPATLTEARGGTPDDLKLIKGVGKKLESLCHKLGFYHFDQVAGWTAAEVAWVDENLEGFKGPGVAGRLGRAGKGSCRGR